MFCPDCGTANSDSGTFCTKCGAILSSGSSHVPGIGMDPDSVCVPAQPFAPSMQPVRAEGCVAAAWHDITGTPGWLKKMLLLGLLNLIPILNWIVPGYALRWARELSFGRREDMPHSIFGERTFVTGFFCALILALVTLVVWIVSYVLGLVGGYRFDTIVRVITIVGSVFLGMFVNVCIIRMAVCDNLGAAFSFSKCGKAYGKSLGSLFCASVVPGLITGLIGAAIMLLILIIFSFFVAGGIASYSYSGGGSQAMVAQMAMQMGVMGLFLLLIVFVLLALFQAISVTITARALGHWAARVVPEWAAEAQMNSYGAYQNATPYGQVAGMGAYVAPSSIPEPAPVPSPGFPAASDSYPPSSVSPITTPSAARDDSTTLLGGGSASTPGRLSLVLIRTNGQRFDVSSFPATVGKGSAANVCIAGNTSISRVHVRISQAGTSLVVEDLGSTNKTYLNGDCLAEGELVILKDGDELRLGDETLTVHLR